jgi:hypothetical protein
MPIVFVAPGMLDFPHAVNGYRINAQNLGVGLTNNE